MVVDLVVKTKNADALDKTVQQMGAFAVVEGSYDGEKCRVRCFGNAAYLKFAIGHQGYGEVLGEEPVAS